jgi:hypothetical protein
MQLKLDRFLPVAIVLIVGFAIWYNAFDPPAVYNNQVLVPTTTTPHFVRDVGEVDGNVKITHKPSGDVLDLDVFDNYLMFPPGVKGSERKFDPNTGKEDELWKISYERKRYFLDYGFDIGTYAGYLSGDKEGTEISDFDVGIRISPARWAFGSVSFPDGLVSNQGIGLGISVYPEPIHFGNFIDHIGIGYGRFYTLEDDQQRNLFYLSFSTRF